MGEKTKRRSIRAKFLFLILSVTIAIFIVTLTVISINYKNSSLSSAMTITDRYAEQYSTEAKAYLDEYMDIARAIGDAFEGKENYPIEGRRKVFMNILHDILQANPHFLAVWTIWEPNAIDGLDSAYVLKQGCTHIGSFSTTYYRDQGRIQLEDSGTEGPLFQGSYYTVPKATKLETILDPFHYSYTGNEADAILQTNMIVPIVIDQKFHGVVGIDAALEEFESIINKIHPFDDGYAFILANDGSFVAHPDLSNIGVNYADYAEEINKQNGVISKIKNGEKFNFTWINQNSSLKYYYSFSPIYVGNTETPWSIAVVVPHESILYLAKRNILVTLLFGLIGMILLAIFLNYLSNKISKPLVKISDEMQKLNTADVAVLDKIAGEEKNEIGNIADSSHQLIDWINRTGEFANEIGTGNYDHTYDLFNANDLLGKSLMDMRDKLKKSKIELDTREIENQQSTWKANGIAEINEIIRKNNNDLENLYYLILSTVIKYIDANQGGLFLIEENRKEEKILELKAAFAYNRKKYIKKRLHLKDGLVGQCALEKDKIILTEIPEEYLEINSGLGESNPRNIVLIPLLFNDDIFGVIELASFHILEDYVIEFLEELGEVIASTISIIKTNIQTANLLERSQQQAEELESRERELQQNLEELKSVHEQMDDVNKQTEIREKNVIAILDGIPDGIITCTSEGQIIDFNPIFQNLVEFERDEMEGKNIEIILPKLSFKELEQNKKHKAYFNIKGKKQKQFNFMLSTIQKVDQMNYMFLVRAE